MCLYSFWSVFFFVWILIGNLQYATARSWMNVRDWSIVLNNDFVLIWLMTTWWFALSDNKEKNVVFFKILLLISRIQPIVDFTPRFYKTRSWNQYHEPRQRCPSKAENGCQHKSGARYCLEKIVIIKTQNETFDIWQRK